MLEFGLKGLQGEMLQPILPLRQRQRQKRFITFQLPELDVVKGAMITNCVAFVPAILGKSAALKSGNQSTL